jgi:hypothetical protein
MSIEEETKDELEIRGLERKPTFWYNRASWNSPDVLEAKSLLEEAGIPYEDSPGLVEDPQNVVLHTHWDTLGFCIYRGVSGIRDFVKTWEFRANYKSKEA